MCKSRCCEYTNGKWRALLTVQLQVERTGLQVLTRQDEAELRVDLASLQSYLVV